MQNLNSYTNNTFFFRDSLMKQNDRMSSLTKLKDSANNDIDNLMKIVKEALNDLNKSREAYTKLGTENESMKATKSKVDSTIEKETKVLEEIHRGVNKAKDHSDKLKQQVRLFY